MYLLVLSSLAKGNERSPIQDAFAALCFLCMLPLVEAEFGAQKEGGVTPLVQGFGASEAKVGSLQEFKPAASELNIGPGTAGRGNMVPRMVWCIWFGPPMTGKRLEGFNIMQQNLQMPIKLVTQDNVQQFEIPKHPLHPLFWHLTRTHKSDYLRHYLMHHYGGGYTDIKPRSNPWTAADYAVFDDESVWMNGVHEKHIEWVAGNSSVQRAYSELASNCGFIMRPHTPLSTLTTSRQNHLLETISDALQKADGRNCSSRCHPRDPKHPKAHGLGSGPIGYPLRWTEIGGSIFHPAQYETARGHIAFTIANYDKGTYWRGSSEKHSEEEDQKRGAFGFYS
jgi:hypothetical protein